MAAAAEDPRPICIADYLRSATDDTASACRSAAQDPEHIPRLPLLCSLSLDGTTLIALDGLTALDLPTNHSFPPHPDTIAAAVEGVKIHRIPLPDHLRGCELTSSSGHFLLLQRPGPLPAFHLFSPFSSPARFASLPPPPLRHNFPASVTVDTAGRIALAILSYGYRVLAYASLDSNNSRWIKLTKRTPRHPKSGQTLSFEYPFLYAGGLFYGVDGTGTQVYALDLSAAPRVEFTDMTFDLPNNHSVPGDPCCHQSASLVLSGTSIFLVRWRKIFSSNTESREMDVFLLDARGKKWDPVTSLGDRSFFVGQNLSISMSAADFPELKRNRVYLCRGAATHISGDKLHCSNYREFRMHLFYDLEDGSWSDFHEAVTLFRANTGCLDMFSVWMLPPRVIGENFAKACSAGIPHE